MRVFGKRAMAGEKIQLTQEDTIPLRALKQTLDKTHEEFKAWLQDQSKQASTFAQATRFSNPKILYGKRAEGFSIVDVEQIWKKYNGAPDIGKVSFRKDQFLTKEQIVQILEEKQLQDIKSQKIQAARDREENERNAQTGDSRGQGMIPQQKIRFATNDHSVVKEMEPFVRQIIKDMKHHAKNLSEMPS